MTDVSTLSVAPLEAERWHDLVALFGPERGAYSKCWCMWWRLSSREFDEHGGEGRRDALRARAQRGPAPGLLAYRDGRPIGWIAVAPREEYERLNRSPLLKALDETPVWAITCLYVDRSQRRTGVAARLVEAAVEYAGTQGATVVEAYPHDVPPDERADASVFMGTRQLFAGAGFVEVARRRHRAIMRRSLSASVSPAPTPAVLAP